MGLQTTVFFGNITNLSDARYAAGMMVDMIGFPVEAQEQGISIEDYKEIRGWVTGPKVVLETASVDPKAINETIESLSFDFVQLTQFSKTIAIDKIDKPVILATDLGVENLDACEKWMGELNVHANLAYFILNITDPAVLDHEHFDRLIAPFPVLISGSLSAKQLKTCHKRFPIEGIALKGAEEEKPGFRDFGVIADILEIFDED